MNLVLVTWVDSMHCSGWMSREKAKQRDSMTHYSVGFELDRDKERIAIVQSCGSTEDSNVDAIMEIPLCAVKKIEIVRKNAVK